ncbi:MAG: SGNH/GDSL hydrolase family protein [Rhodoferax sp.]|jgi:outer membrane lipase/esterase|nr:SGNH/GDSL hydrolase family protein [Rhodoferax sp.]MBP9061654.1 SGNH/GDSL hydrolase family protein [Rhodoferax sp.]MBP9686044.1 SGNH/GDSL hydrolase family protein [Rhodoferax sp.]
MRPFKLTLTLLAAASLVACGGGSVDGGATADASVSDSLASPRAFAAASTSFYNPWTNFSKQVTFGDSLSDVGTYAVGTVAALGGGKFSVNNVVKGVNQSKNWTEVMAAGLGLPRPCAAQTGLDGDASKGFKVAVVNHSACTNYAQGGARVTNPVGPGNKLLGGNNAVLGQLTVPVATQIKTHLAKSRGRFSGWELVQVLAGANDVFIQLATLSNGATAAATAAVTAAVPAQIAADIAAGTCDPANAQTTCVTAAVAKLTPTVGAQAAGAYVQTNAPAAVGAMATAGAELAALVNTQILAKGAKAITVINVPDMAKTPFALSQSAATQALIDQMVTTFNSQLKAKLSTSSAVLYVDAYAVSQAQFANPAYYGLTNVTLPACDLTPLKNVLGSSLVCNKGNLIPGVVTNYQFADAVHPTPYGHSLLAYAVAMAMHKKGWL